MKHLDRSLSVRFIHRRLVSTSRQRILSTIAEKQVVIAHQFGLRSWVLLTRQTLRADPDEEKQD